MCAGAFGRGLVTGSRKSMATVWLVIGTIGMGAATIVFALLGIRAPQGSRYFFVITALITLIAFVSYLTMATGQGES
jgi:bacteriorhodopsin